MADESVTKPAGLYTAPNPLSSVPSGALKEALNCVINFPGVIESRRGSKRLTYTFGTSDSRGTQLLSYLGTLLVAYDTNKLAHDTGTAWTDYSGSYAKPANATRIRGVESNQNLYFTTAAGVKVLDDAAGTPVSAGIPQGPAPTSRRVRAALSAVQGAPSGSGFTGDPGDGWMPADTQVAYVGVIGTRDARANVKLGQESWPFILVNPPDITIAAGDITRASVIGAVTLPDEADGLGKYYPPGSRVSFVYTPGDPQFGDGVKSVIDNGEWETNHFNFTLTNTGSHTSVNPALLSTDGRDVELIIDLSSADLTTDNFLRIYRTKISTAFDTRPTPDYFLVREVPITSGMLSAGFYTFIDSAADELLGDPFYRNINVGGEPPDGAPENDNSRSPLCSDLALWDGRMWGGDLSERQNLDVTLLGVSGGTIFGQSGDGLQNGDTVTAAGGTYTATTYSFPLSLSNSQFLLYDTITYPSFTQADCIALTAQSLALVVYQNNATSSAAYTSKLTDIVPGRVTFTARGAATTAFTFASSRNSAWDPDPTGAISSSGDAAQNGLWFSKQEEPEAVPLGNRLTVGAKSGRILRIKALSDRLWVFTTRGVFTVSGVFPYRVDLVTKTALLLAPDSLVDFDDALWGLTTQGFARMTAGGIGVASGPIDTDVKRLYGDGLEHLVNLTVAAGYESYNKFIATMPTEASDTVATQQLVYDSHSKAWTKWDLPYAAMIVVPETDLLYGVSTDANTVCVERKTFTRADYTDHQNDVSIVDADGLTVTVNSVTDIEVGDALYQSEDVWALVTAVNVGPTTVTVDSVQTWNEDPGADTFVFKAINNRIIFSEIFAGKPNHLKHFPAVTYHLRNSGMSTAEALFVTDLGPSEDEPILIPARGFGEEPWGLFPWADPEATQNVRVGISKNAPRANFLRVGFLLREAFAVWGLYGFTAEENVNLVK